MIAFIVLILINFLILQKFSGSTLKIPTMKSSTCWCVMSQSQDIHV